MVCREVAPYANLGDVARIVTYGHFLDVVRYVGVLGDG
jgi:hypothetical protein